MKKKDFMYWSVLLILMTIPILVDFVRMDISTEMFSDASYWLGILGVQIPSVFLMLVSRTHSKVKEMQENTEYAKLKNAIAQGYSTINSKGISQSFESYVQADNRERKINAYCKKIGEKKVRLEKKLIEFNNAVARRKLKLQLKNRNKDNLLYGFLFRDTKKIAIEQAIAYLQKLIDNAERNVSLIKVKYSPVTVNIIFGQAQKDRMDDIELRANESGEIVSLLVNKALGVMLFSIAATSYVLFDVQGDIVTIIYKGVIKLMQLVLSVYYGNLAGSEFVRGELMNRTRKKVSYLQQFIDKHNCTQVQNID